MKPMTTLMSAAIAATLLMPAAAMAASPDSKNQGYLVDTYGNSVTMSGRICAGSTATGRQRGPSSRATR